MAMNWEGDLGTSARAVSGARLYEAQKASGGAVLRVTHANGKQMVYVFDSIEKAIGHANDADKLLQAMDRVSPGVDDGEDYPEGDA